MNYNKKILALITLAALAAQENYPMDFFKKATDGFNFATSGILPSITAIITGGTLLKKLQDHITEKQRVRLTELQGKLTTLEEANGTLRTTLEPLPAQVEQNTQAINGTGEHKSKGLIHQVDGIEQSITEALQDLGKATAKKEELETALKELQQGEEKHQELAKDIQKHIDEQTDQITLLMAQITGLNAQAEVNHKELLQKITTLEAQAGKNTETTATLKFEAEKVQAVTQQLKATTQQESEGLQQKIIQTVATQYISQLSAKVKNDLVERERSQQTVLENTKKSLEKLFGSLNTFDRMATEKLDSLHEKMTNAETMVRDQRNKLTEASKK